ncbi:MAG: MFS transporter [Deltaproteobacteria bacterium]|nr:MFS transporter [Deltaproteobacteria bacterium]
MQDLQKTVAPHQIFQLRNVRLFIAFSVFFTSRFYYPVFTILFLDFGLTLEQFALLNAAWAATIVLFEVPSGALADVIGRRNLLVFAGSMMVLEMALLCFAPRGNATWLFIIILINRVVSGIAEAAASGADEAIAYDTLKKHNLEKEWPKVLSRQMRYQSIAHIVSMSVGAAIYDPSLMQRAADTLYIPIQFNQGITLRFPLYLTLLMALCAFWTTWRMRETESMLEDAPALRDRCVPSVIQAFGVTLNAGRWILHTPFALVIILVGLFFDHCIRMVVTLTSQYYRLIQLPEASFGIIGSVISGLGIFIPRIARGLVQKQSPIKNLWVMVVITLLGLAGMAFVRPIIGLVPVIFISSMMYLLHFFMSHYLNRITSSKQRATVLSFKGLSFNLAYGLFGVLYAACFAILRDHAIEADPPPSAADIENIVFSQTLIGFPVYFIVFLFVVVTFARWALKNNMEYNNPG